MLVLLQSLNSGEWKRREGEKEKSCKPTLFMAKKDTKNIFCWLLRDNDGVSVFSSCRYSFSFFFFLSHNENRIEIFRKIKNRTKFSLFMPKMLVFSLPVVPSLCFGCITQKKDYMYTWCIEWIKKREISDCTGRSHVWNFEEGIFFILLASSSIFPRLCSNNNPNRSNFMHNNICNIFTNKTIPLSPRFFFLFFLVLKINFYS